MVAGVQHKKIICVIPARYKSSRFPGKPLHKIFGKEMIARTYRQVAKCSELDNIVVATDNDQIKSFCEYEDIPCVITPEECLTGTDRVAAVSKLDEYQEYEFFINVQGDEPVIDPVAVQQILKLQRDSSHYEIYNLFKLIDDKNSISSQSIIKVVTNQKNEMLYYSRLPIPFSNTRQKAKHYMQVPIYGYTRGALAAFSNRKDKTKNEQFEDVELLRFLDMGYKIKMAETTINTIAVDHLSDVPIVEDLIKKNPDFYSC